MEIGNVEEFLNDYLVYNNALPNCVLDNLYLFYKIAEEVEELLEKYFKNGIKIDTNNFTKVTLEEKIEIVKQYFKDCEIDFNIEKYISDGTIEFVDYNQQNENYDFFDIYNCFRGQMYRENKGAIKLIDVCENGLASDICLLIHEISHFRDEPLNPRNQISNLLTETLAYTETLISADYLNEIGFFIEAQSVLKMEGNILYNIVKKYKKVAKLFLVYMEFGNIERESYQYFFAEEKEENTDYEENVKFLKENFSYDLIYETWHLLGIYLAPYLLNEYKKDKDFMKDIINLHKQINEKDFIDCIKIMKLHDLGKEDRNIILASMHNVLENHFKEKGKKL